jgi:hypothetical protein
MTRTYLVGPELPQALVPGFDDVFRGRFESEQRPAVLGLDGEALCRMDLSQQGLTITVQLGGIDSGDAFRLEILQYLFDFFGREASACREL